MEFITLSNGLGYTYEVPVNIIGPMSPAPVKERHCTDILLLGVAVKELAVLSVIETPEQIKKLIEKTRS